MESNPVLVTGAAGFIGRRLVQNLCRSGVPVRAILRPRHDGEELETSGAEILRGDAADRELMLRASVGCGAIYHLAAARGPRKLSGSEYCRINAELLEAAAHAAHANGALLVAASTVSVLGGRPPLAPADSRHRPVSSYGLSRSQNERRLQDVWGPGGLDYRIARIAERVAGPGARDWLRIVCAVRDGRYRVLPRGGAVHSCDVDDVVAGLRLCASDAGASGQIYLLTAREPASMQDALGSIAEELGIPFAPRFVPGWPARTYKRIGDLAFSTFGRDLPYAFTAGFYAWPNRYDTARTSERLGFAPRYSICDALRRTTDWMRSEGLV